MRREGSLSLTSDHKYSWRLRWFTGKCVPSIFSARRLINGSICLNSSFTFLLYGWTWWSECLKVNYSTRQASINSEHELWTFENVHRIGSHDDDDDEGKKGRQSSTLSTWFDWTRKSEPFIVSTRYIKSLVLSKLRFNFISFRGKVKMKSFIFVI